MPPRFPKNQPDTPGHSSVAAAIERVAAEHGGAVAATEQTNNLTYDDLLARSGSIAESLVRRGVTPGRHVLIALPRGLEYLCAVVAVVRAGGVYVPVDPDWPADRLDEIRRIVNPSAVIAAPGFDALGPATDVGELSDNANRFVPPTLSSDAPCYVMFTSGTTGEPKGVAVPHRAVLRLVIDPDAYEVGPDRSWLHLSSTSFDASTLEIWAPLLNGGRCVTVPDSLPSIDRLSAILRETGATDAWLTASLFNAVVDHAPDAFAGMRQVLTGGERVSPEHARRFLRRWPGVRLINGYGPTENTTFTCCHTIEPRDTENPGGVPIGLPIRGTEVLIVDEQDRPIENDHPGELLAGGDGVALGYLGDDKLTADRFVTLADAPGRWYRTGDLARRRLDGVIEFLGRRDRQVKIRGHRIELLEIEAQIGDHPAVERAFAMALGDRADLNRLAAAYSCHGSPVEPENLRHWLLGHVPRHLVPDAIVLLDTVPVGPNGKVDLDAIRTQIEGDTSRSAAPKKPGDAPERHPGWRALETMLAEILPGAVVRPDDSFLGIGGHSIAALRLAAGLRAEHRARVTVGRILACDALADLADEIGRRDGAGAAQPASAPIEAGPIPAASIQQQFFFEQAIDTSGSAYHEFAAFRAGPGLDLVALERAWRGLVERHEILRTRLELRDDRLIQHVDPPDAAADAEFDVHTPLGWPEDRTPREAAEVLLAPFDLEHQFPARLHVFRLTDGSFGVVFVFHHMAVDEWAIGLIASELGTLYKGGALPPPVPFRRYCEHESAEQSDAEIDRIAGRLLGVDRGRTTLGRAPAPGVGHPVLAGVSAEQLARRAHELRCTPSAVLLALFSRALSDVFDRPHAAILTPISHRTSPALQRIVGCCNTMHPVLVSSRAPDLAAAARATQLELIDAYNRPIAPYADVVRAAQRRSGGRGFSVEFGFAFQTNPGFTPDLGGVRVGPLRCPGAAARFPMALLLHTEGERVVGALVASAGSEAESRLRDMADAIERGMNGQAVDHRSAISAGSPTSTPRAPITVEPVRDDDPIRREAARAWQTLLGAAPASDDEHFFDRGGHSLLLLRLAARIRAATGVELPMGPFLERPDFGRLIRCLRDAQAVEKQAGRTFRVVELRRGERTILALPGAIGRPILFNRLAREMTEHNDTSPGLLCYDLFEPINRLGPAEGLDRVLTRLLGDLHRPDVVGVVGYSVGGLLPLFLSHIPPEIERRVHLWLVDVFHPDALRAAGLRSRESLQNALRYPHRVPLALVDSARITRRLVRKNITHQDELGLDLPAIEKLRLELRRRSTRVWRGAATVFVAGRKPIWQPHFDESEINGMAPFLGGDTRRVVIPHLHQDLLARGARRIVRVMTDDLQNKAEP